MPLLPLPDLATLPPGRLLGLDVGTKTIGLALSDTRRVIASPMETLRRGKRFAEDAGRLAEIVRAQDVAGLVVGLPLGLDGRDTPRTQSVRAFVRNLAAVIELPIAFWDERLSTSAVERFLIGELDLTRKRRADVVDRTAAAWILQGALDRIRVAEQT